MKINITLDVSDDLRRLMGTAPTCKKTHEGLAIREEVIHFVRAKLLTWEVIAEGFSIPAQVSEQEKADLMDAIAYLTAQGSGPTYIKRWIFKQRARRDFINAKLS